MGGNAGEVQQQPFLGGREGKMLVVAELGAEALEPLRHRHARHVATPAGSAQDAGVVDTSGVVLAGGLSRRMGADKRLLLVDGEPMLRRVAATVTAVADELIVVVAPSRPLPPGVLDGLHVRVATDRRSDAGPLAAIEAGLLAATAGRALVVAGDLPWLDARLLRDLLAGLDGVDAVAADGGRGPEPLLAAYRRHPGLAAATRLLDAGERRARKLLEELGAITMPDAGPSTWNVNRPADVAGGVVPSPPRQ